MTVFTPWIWVWIYQTYSLVIDGDFVLKSKSESLYSIRCGFLFQQFCLKCRNILIIFLVIALVRIVLNFLISKWGHNTFEYFLSVFRIYFRREFQVDSLDIWLDFLASAFHSIHSNQFVEDSWKSDFPHYSPRPLFQLQFFKKWGKTVSSYTTYNISFSCTT